jgi:hypothetical protein
MNQLKLVALESPLYIGDPPNTDAPTYAQDGEGLPTSRPPASGLPAMLSSLIRRELGADAASGSQSAKNVPDALRGWLVVPGLPPVRVALVRVAPVLSRPGTPSRGSTTAQSPGSADTRAAQAAPEPSAACGRRSIPVHDGVV